MAELLVTVRRLNRRNKIPTNFPDRDHIVGTVGKGYRFEGIEEAIVPNPSLGKWYRDRDNYFFWGGGLAVLDAPPSIAIKVKDLPYDIPDDYRIGIDISHHNSLPDWGSIKTSGVSFVYLKLSEGVGTPDEKAAVNAERAKQLGFKIGYYHFCRPDARNRGTVRSDATAEADGAIKRIDAITQADLPLVLDLENQQGWDTPLGKSDYLLWVNTFTNHIERRMRSAPMIYSRKNYLDHKLPANHDLGRYKLWISRYTQNLRKVQCPIGWRDWSMWQYTDSAVLGSNSKLDMNILKDTTLF